MKIQSAKAKGRRLCVALKELILRTHRDLEDADILVPTSSVPGEDLKLSPKAQKAFPFAVECKSQESLNVWASLAQAFEHQAKTGRTALLVFTRNRAPTYVALRLENFLLIQARANLFEKTILAKGGGYGEKESCKEEDCKENEVN
jgi:hypothetical protein